MGTAEICGINVISHPAEVRKLLGWMPDHFGNYEHMTVLEYLDFYARALGYSGRERKERIDEVMEFTELGSLVDRFSNKLSKTCYNNLLGFINNIECSTCNKKSKNKNNSK